jgi:Leucine-rich repeat (LRR) protein
LTSLPPLHSELGVLNAAGNHLTHLQEVLPEKLREIDVSENKLETLPDLLPEGLESIDISDNPLVELPESIKALDSDVEVTARWIPEEVYQELDLAVFRGKVRCQVDCSGTVYSG